MKRKQIMTTLMVTSILSCGTAGAYAAAGFTASPESGMSSANHADVAGSSNCADGETCSNSEEANPNAFKVKKLYYYVGDATSPADVPADQWKEFSQEEVARINSSNGDMGYIKKHPIEVEFNTPLTMAEFKKKALYLKIDSDKEGVSINQYTNLMDRPVKEQRGSKMVFNSVSFYKGEGDDAFWRAFNLTVNTSYSNIKEVTPIMKLNKVTANQAKADAEVATLSMPTEFNGAGAVKYVISSSLPSPYANMLDIIDNKVVFVNDLYYVLAEDYHDLPETSELIDAGSFTEEHANLKAGARIPIVVKAKYGDGESVEVKDTLVIAPNDEAEETNPSPKTPEGENGGTTVEQPDTTGNETGGTSGNSGGSGNAGGSDVTEKDKTGGTIVVNLMGEVLPENILTSLKPNQVDAYKSAIKVGPSLYRLLDVTSTVKKDKYEFRLPLDKKLIQENKRLKKVVHLTKDGKVEEFTQGLEVQYDSDGAPFVLLETKTLSPFIAIYDDKIVNAATGNSGDDTSSANAGTSSSTDAEANKDGDKTVTTATDSNEAVSSAAIEKKEVAGDLNGKDKAVSPAKGTIVQTGDNVDLNKGVLMGVVSLFALMLGGFVTILRKIKS